MMELTVAACTACDKAPPTTPVATSPSTARRPACAAAASPSADALTTTAAALALLAARLLGRTPCERPVIDAMACAISAVVGAFSLTVSVRFVGRSVEHEQSCVAKIYVARSRRRHLI